VPDVTKIEIYELKIGPYEIAEIADKLEFREVSHRMDIHDHPLKIEGNDCLGIITYSNGDVYKGTLQGKERYGKGVLTYVNNDVYIGEWENDIKKGNGIFISANGSSYNGEWENDTMSSGTYVWDNGDTFTGTWENDTMRDGTYTWKNGNIYNGTWLPNQTMEHGTLINLDGTVSKFV
jgi:hypothetical protein